MITEPDSTSRPGSRQAAADQDRRQPAEHDVRQRRLQAHVQGHLPGQRITQQPTHPIGDVVRAVFLPDLRQPEQRRHQRRNHPEAQAQCPAVIEMLAQRHGGTRRHRRAQAQGHGVDAGHGPGVFGEVALDDARQQHADDADACATEHAAGEQADLTEVAAQNDPAGQGQQDPQHHPLGAETPRQIGASGANRPRHSTGRWSANRPAPPTGQGFSTLR
jgi:hypothetical protein